MPVDEAMRLVAAQGFHGVEFWDWRERDVGLLQRQAQALGLAVTACSGTTFDEPLLDPAGHDVALARLQGSLAVAQQLAAPLLVVEPLNSIVDHPGYFLDSLPDALQLLEDVGHPAVRLLLDIYHMWVMHGDLMAVADAASATAHVHAADVPGRGEPGSGVIPWQTLLTQLRDAGYQGAIGLECWPTTAVHAALRRCDEVLNG